MPGQDTGSIRFKDMQPDGYVWKKYGQKPNGKSEIRNYFRCVQPGCQAKKIVTVDKVTREMKLSYVNSHNHERYVAVSAVAHSYEQYLTLIARCQQFETTRGFINGYGEPIDPTHPGQIGTQFPLKISLQMVQEDIVDEPTELMKYEAQVRCEFDTQQDFLQCKQTQNSLTDPKQQLVFDGFTFVKYG